MSIVYRNLQSNNKQTIKACVIENFNKFKLLVVVVVVNIDILFNYIFIHRVYDTLDGCDIVYHDGSHVLTSM